MKILILALLLIASPLYATEYFVGKSGSNANSCATAQSSSAANRKLTIQAGVNCATGSGDITTVGDGSYSEQVSMPQSGTAGNKITLRSENHLGATILGTCASGSSNAAANNYPIWVNNKSYIVIGGQNHGFKVTCGFNPILIYPASTNVDVLYNEVSLGYDSGILYYAGSNNGLVQGNLVHENNRTNWPRGIATVQGRSWGNGISVAGNTSGTCVEDNVVYWNNGEGIGADCIKRNIIADNWSVQAYAVDTPNTVIDRNFIYVSTDAANWAVVPGANPSMQTPEGIAASAGDTPGYPNSVNGLRVTNNIVVGGYRCFDRFPSSLSFDDTDMLIANNTFIRCSGSIDYQNNGAISGLKIENNILEGAINPSAVTVRVNPAATASTFSNNLYNTTTTALYWGGTLYNSLASWAAVSGEVNSTNGVSPQLSSSSVNPCRLWADGSLSAPCALSTLTAQIPNYYLLTGSPARDAGANLATYITTDYVGTTRPSGSAWDIGAHEFVAAGGAPSISIVSPSQNGSYSTEASTVNLSGLASDDVSVVAVTWTCATCTPTSGSATGTTAWSISSIGLADGANTITVFASDGLLNSNAVLVVTKSTTANALVLHLRMSEGAGATVADTSGLGNNGNTDCAWSAQGKHNFGVLFDGSCSIIVSEDASLHMSTGFSLEAWVFPTTSSGGRSVITKNYDYYLYSSINGWCGAGNAIFGGFEDGGSRNACDGAAITLNGWTHLATTYDGATVKLYKNGTLINSTSYVGTVSANTGTLQIGNNQFSEGFVGVLDDVLVYNYAVDVSQILIDMEEGTPTTPIELKIGSGTSIKVGSGTSVKIGP